MNMATKNNIFERYKKEYWKADRARQSEILDHLVDVTQMHRKSTVRRFRVLQKRSSDQEGHRGRPTYYTKDVDDALYTLWEAADRPCGELLHPLIRDYITSLKRHGEWRYGDETTGKLAYMGKRTVRRRVEAFEEKYGDSSHGVSATKPSQLKSIIPVFKGPWDKLPPGSGQIDTVAHCGESLSGDYVYTVCYIDAPTYWVIPRAQWNKGEEATKESLRAIQARLPVPIGFLHPDTGTEFINWSIKKWCDEEDITMARSEPNRKNDNMYVEERNGHVVRKYLGYLRLDDPSLVDLVNELFEVLAPFLNHFQAVRRTEEKIRVGGKYKRKHEKTPKPPYERMMERSDVSDEVKARLQAEHEQLNPWALKQEIDRLVTKIKKKARLR
jgi:hypothetical protein